MMQVTKIFQNIKILERMNPKQRNIIIGAVAALLIFFICYNFVYKKGKEKAAYYNIRFREVSIQNDLRQQIKILDETSAKYENLILQKSDIDTIKNRLSRLASDSGASVMSISSIKKTGLLNYSTFTTTLELRCTYHQLGNFVSTIENAQPYIGITSLNIMSSELQIGAGASDIAAVNLVIETYALRK